MQAKSMDSDYEILMCNITWLRKNYGLSKKKMAKLIGIGVYSLNKIEKGEFPKNLKADVILNIKKHFGILPEMLLTKRLEK